MSDVDDQLETFKEVLHDLFVPSDEDASDDDGADDSAVELGDSQWTFRQSQGDVRLDWSEWSDETREELRREDDDVVPKVVEDFFEGARLTRLDNESEGLALLDVQHDLDDGTLTTTVGPSGRCIGFVTLDIVQGTAETIEDCTEREAADFWRDDDHRFWSDGESEGWEERLVQLRVAPKLERADWTRLLALSEGWGELNFSGEARLDEEMSSIPHLLAAAYASALEELFETYGGLRQTHARVEANLEAQIQGRLKVPEYLNHVARGEVTSVPCEYSELSIDNWPNRTLLWGLHLAQLLVRDTPDEEGSGTLWSDLRRHRPRFAEVERQRVRPPDLDKLNHLPEAFRGYHESGALELARFLIRNLKLGDTDGSLRTEGFYIDDMAQVFEEAFARQVAAHDDVDAAFEDIQQEQWNFSVEKSAGDVRDDTNGNRHVRPDVFIDESQSNDLDVPLVADTKWKRQVELEAGDIKGVSIGRSDLYQIAGYTHVANARSDSNDGAVGFLVYPCAQPEDELFDHENVDPFEVQWKKGESNLDLYAIPWCVEASESRDDNESYSVEDYAEEVVDTMLDEASSDD